MAYRRRRVCDNCDVILKHKTQRGLRCHDNASLAAGPAVEDADACLSTIDDELLSRNNQPLGSNVISFTAFAETVDTFYSRLYQK